MNIDYIRRPKKEFVVQKEYECDLCGMQFGDSLGDMELHKLLVHLQDSDMNLG
ncbi:MAG TPA: hypothetical protein VJR94_08110 [Candidatus Nitrosocosmicus sp.]|nr:hypothetical protein [Candidatus Nitrosocosmicus sp.]